MNIQPSNCHLYVLFHRILLIDHNIANSPSSKTFLELYFSEYNGNIICDKIYMKLINVICLFLKIKSMLPDIALGNRENKWDRYDPCSNRN